MSEQTAPIVNAARYVVPVELDMAAANSALDRFEERVNQIAGRLGELRDQGGTRIDAPQPPAPVNATTPPAARSDDRGRDIDELRGELKKTTDAVEDLRDAVEELTAAMASMTTNQGL